jgi:hypothetical protein
MSSLIVHFIRITRVYYLVEVSQVPLVSRQSLPYIPRWVTGTLVPFVACPPATTPNTVHSFTSAFTLPESSPLKNAATGFYSSTVVSIIRLYRQGPRLLESVSSFHLELAATISLHPVP